MLYGKAFLCMWWCTYTYVCAHLWCIHIYLMQDVAMPQNVQDDAATPVPMDDSDHRPCHCVVYISICVCGIIFIYMLFLEDVHLYICIRFYFHCSCALKNVHVHFLDCF